MSEAPVISESGRRLEAVLFMASRPVPAAELGAACSLDPEELEGGLLELKRHYASGRRGVELLEVGGGYIFAVTPDCTAAVEAFAGARRPEDLSPALLETLSVVAYLQPTTRAEVARVRGVSSEWALGCLEERGLVQEAGRADAPGSPILYATTGRFLTLFGLRRLDDLPPIEGFALGEDAVEELRARLLTNAERRPS